MKKKKSDSEENVFDLIPAKIAHGAVDFKDDGVIVGFKEVCEGETVPIIRFFYVIGDKDGFRAEFAKQKIYFGNTKYMLHSNDILPLVGERWDFEDIKSFIEAPACPDGLFENIKNEIQHYIELPTSAHYSLIASWIIATYFTHSFPAFPFFLLHGPKESGKSKLMEILELLCFNAAKVKDTTVPAMSAIIDGTRGTLLLDQAESLSRNKIGILADSYKKFGAKRIVQKSKNRRINVAIFSAYGPKAFATYRSIDFDIADRCCKIGMQRSRQELPDLMGHEPIWSNLRDQCYRFMLIKWQDVKTAFETTNSTGTRRGELWRPLNAVLVALGVDPQEIALIKETFDSGTAQTKSVLTVQEQALFQVLLDETVKKSKFEMSSVEILSAMQEILDKSEHPKPQWVGKAISKFSLANELKKKTRIKRVYYKFSRDVINDMAKRYIDEEPALTALPQSSPEAA